MSEATTVHTGPIHSPVAGRTDHLPIHVPEGSYVIPADVVGALGEGNTMAGFKVLRRMFRGNPYAQGPTPYDQGSAPYGEPLARGGRAGSVAIVAAGGEHVLTPAEVMYAGQGDMDLGHRALDEFVRRYRGETVKTLKKLPGPAQT